MTYEHDTRHSRQRAALHKGIIYAAIVLLITIIISIFTLGFYLNEPQTKIAVLDVFIKWFAGSESVISSKESRFGLQLWEQGVGSTVSDPKMKVELVFASDVKERSKLMNTRTHGTRDLKLLVETMRNNPKIQILESRVGELSATTIRTQAIGLLPGENLLIQTEAGAPPISSLALRCFGATPDRQDAPARLTIEGAGGESTPAEISSKGEPSQISITAGIAANFTLKWPNDASGILLVTGVERRWNEQPPGPVMLFTIDRLLSNRGKPVLQRVRDALAIKNGSRPEDPQFAEFSNLWPVSPVPSVNLAGIFLGEKPSDFGYFAQNGFVSLSDANRRQGIEDTALHSGLMSIRANIEIPGIGNASASENVLNPIDDITQAGHFGQFARIMRRREISNLPINPARSFVGKNSFLNLNFLAKVDSLNLTWHTALRSTYSPLYWLAGGWLVFLDVQSPWRQELQYLEKERQIEDVILDIFHTAYELPKKPSVVILVQETSLDQDVGRQESATRPGEIILLSQNRSAISSRPKSLLGSQRELRPLLEAIMTAESKNLPACLPNETSGCPRVATPAPDLIVMQSHKSEIFHATTGRIEIPQQSPEFPIWNTHFTQQKSLWNQITVASELQNVHVIKFQPSEDAPPLDLTFQTNRAFEGCTSTPDTPDQFSLESSTDETLFLRGRFSRPDVVACVLRGRLDHTAHFRMTLTTGAAVPLNPSLVALGPYALTASLFSTPDGSISFDGTQLARDLSGHNGPFRSLHQHFRFFLWRESMPRFESDSTSFHRFKRLDPKDSKK